MSYAQIMRCRAIDILIAVALAFSKVQAQEPSTPPHTPGNKIVVLGDHLEKSIEQKDGLVTEPAITTYVQHLAAGIGAAGSVPPLQIRVTRSPDEYANLFPKRVLYLSSGLLLRAETEAELAAILAHEQAHKVSVRLTSASQPLLRFVMFGDCVLSQTYVPLAWASSMRQGEVNANMAGMRTLRLAHYDPESLVVILSKLTYEHSGWDKAIVSSDLKLARNIVESQPPPSDGYIVDTSEFARMRNALERATGSVPQPTTVTLPRKSP